MRRGRIGIALLSLAVAGCAAGPSLPREGLDGWHAIRHPSFRLLGAGPPEELRGLADELAPFDRVFVRLARMPVEPDLVEA